MEQYDWVTWWRQNGERELRDVLMLWWDPIGVYGEPGAYDEYDDYARGIASLLRRGTTVEEVAGRLSEIADREMELGRAHAASERAAAKVVEWYDQAMRQRDQWQPVERRRRGGFVRGFNKKSIPSRLPSPRANGQPPWCRKHGASATTD